MTNLLTSLDFRKPTEVTHKILEYKGNTLIVITRSGRRGYFQSPYDKFEALKNVNLDEDLVLFVWTGKWKSDVFHLDKKFVKEYLKEKTINI